MEIPTVEEVAARHFREHAELVAQQLERFAAQVRDIAADAGRVGEPGVRTYAGVAAAVQASYANLQPNLALDILTKRAVEADVARAKGQ